MSSNMAGGAQGGAGGGGEEFLPHHHHYDPAILLPQTQLLPHGGLLMVHPSASHWSFIVDSAYAKLGLLQCWD